jgi:hypothetical protein
MQLQIDDGITDSLFLEHSSRKNNTNYTNLWDFYQQLDIQKRALFDTFVTSYMEKAHICNGDSEQYSLLRRACIEIALKYYFL